MGRIFPLLFLVGVALAAIALISCLAAEEDDIRALPRPVWVVIVLFMPLVGPIAWFLAGRPAPAADGPGGAAAGGQSFTQRMRHRRRPVAPDDDPEFLRSLDSDQAKRERELLSQWEEELRRADEEPREPRGDEDKA